MDKILKGAPQVWLAREIPPRQGTLPLTQVGFPQWTEGQQKDKSQNIADPTGASQVQIPVIIQMSHQLYQSQSSLNNSYSHTKTGIVSSLKDIQ